jgi:hypothetical protein
LGLQLGIGFKVEPLLEGETFQKQKRGIGFIPFVAFSDRIVSDQDPVYSRPIDSGIDLFRTADGAVTIQRVEKSDVGKGKVGFHFFEAHRLSRWVNLKKLWQKYCKLTLKADKSKVEFSGIMRPGGSDEEDTIYRDPDDRHSEGS